MSVIALSVTRAADQAAPAADRQVRRQIQANIAYYAAHPERIDERLAELDREWDLERLLELNSATLSLLGIVLALRGSRRWLVLPIAVQSFFMQHAVQGWCPPVPVFRRLGVRTPAEVESERAALRALRDEHRPVPESTAGAAS
jgi:hypothetical protein